MNTVTSKDGTPIGYATAGNGHPLVFATGAFNDHTTCAGLAALLSDEYTTVTYDRRGRGASGDTAPYAIDREIEDLAALIDAVGGEAAVFGYSSGGMLALQAAVQGLPITHVLAYEPPFATEGHEVVADLPQRMQAAVDAGRPGDAVSLFQREAIGMPDAVVDQIRQSPMFPALQAMAQSVVYDILITVAYAAPTAGMRSLAIPTTFLYGAQTWPQLASAARSAAAAIPGAVAVAVDGGANHAIPDDTTAAAVRAFLGGRHTR
jgi:pimeloyl-ACP methyl ester carboxylesterase